MPDDGRPPAQSIFLPDVEKRECRSCRRKLDLDAFTVDHGKADGRSTICRECDHARWRAWNDRRRLDALRREAPQLRRRIAKLERLVSELVDERDRKRCDHLEHAAAVMRCRRLAAAIAVAARLEARAARYDHVRELLAQGLGAKRIAHELGITRDTARDLIRRAEAAGAPASRRGVSEPDRPLAPTPLDFREKQSMRSQGSKRARGGHHR